MTDLHRPLLVDAPGDTLLTNLKRHLVKAEHALGMTERHLTLTNEANAALHLSDKVFYSPLTSLVHDALEGVRLALREIDPQDGGDHSGPRAWAAPPTVPTPERD